MDDLQKTIAELKAKLPVLKGTELQKAMAEITRLEAYVKERRGGFKRKTTG